MAEQQNHETPGGQDPTGEQETEPERRAAEAARDVKDEAKRKASNAASEVKSQAKQKGSELKQQAERKAERQKRSLAESVTALASALDAAAGSLDEREEGRLADWSRDAGERVRRMASYLERNDVSGLVHDLEDTARDNPAAFVGTSLAAGLAAGRFLRSSRPEQGEEAATDEVGRRRYQAPAPRPNPGMAATPRRSEGVSSGASAAQAARTQPDAEPGRQPGREGGAS